ncbi:C40 family peptidase [Flavobacterium silvaticum]|uniref:C40 family peptidase n=1 Tax=Flavobacterium silvaticum TaxID=1852020 RepID=A0A972FK62_9FLAO|nr:C40 family peptidase [Flavobacterium silvaticum]NMH27182.1 C40 family peptidase [Flavobacterium silvaticum]
MFAKKLFALILPMFCLLAFEANSQVVTSKKEAIKKGIYRKPEVSTEVQSAVSNLTEDKSVKKTTTAQKQTTVTQPVAVAKVAAKPVAKTVTKSKKALIKQTDDADLIADDDNDSYMALQMINNAMSFIGTRYLGGGSTQRGMDCSGMVTAVFNIFDVKLPRSSNEMAKVGVKVAKEEIKKGDLIFFHTNGKRIINHVGMVIEVLGDEIKFVHSSTHEGVIISSTKEPYYKKNFVQANRML